MLPIRGGGVTFYGDQKSRLHRSITVVTKRSLNAHVETVRFEIQPIIIEKHNRVD